MKKINIFLSIALAAVGMISCQDRGWDDEINEDYTVWCDTITEHNVINIADLKSKYQSVIERSDKSFDSITTDIQLKAVVVSNDEGGNLSQQIIVRDGSGQNILIGIAEDDIYSYLHVGDSILVNLKGLYIGGYGKSAQIGYPSINVKGNRRMGRMNLNVWREHFMVFAKTPATEIQKTVLDSINLNNSSLTYFNDDDKLVYVEGRFIDANGTNKLAEEAKADDGNAYNARFIYLKGGQQQVITVRTSCYSDFGAYVMPKGNIRIWGMAIPYNKSQWQMQMRTEKDLLWQCSVCQAWNGLRYYPTCQTCYENKN